MTDVDDAFRWARIHAVRHMAACEQAGLTWGETSITDVVISRAAGAVTVVPFTQPAEYLSGADWVWWWVDSRGAYGMLVQAKRVTVDRSKWTFDFDYPRGEGTQRSTLMSAASILGLLPTYALYLGTADYRSWERCQASHRSGRCIHCVKRSVSLMPALLAESLIVDDAVSTFERSVALEDLWVRSPRRAPLIPALKDGLAPELSDFLNTRQDGTLAVTRSIIDRVLRVRAGAFGAAATGVVNVHSDGAHDYLGSVFSTLPDDTGHWRLNYFQHVLDPLVQAPPWYVLAILSGDYTLQDLAAEMPDSVAGVVVVQLPGEAE